jgi:hypothetical protein
MRSNRWWLLGLLTMATAPYSVSCYVAYVGWADLGRRVKVPVSADTYHQLAFLVAFVGGVASLVVMIRAPGWWKLAGLPGLLLNFGAFMLCGVVV